ncbi:uncharacterized protein LOC119665353, partial [Teleopsis dalmanni]|uniref:uncharacterized protein LOC119665353 n=1 Tax=Teleopsis dalmanni TaxID=139649 RepID=UPI0018CF0E6E
KLHVEAISGQCEKRATGNAAIAEWKLNDSKAKADLILLISTSELKLIKNCETSKQLWSKLENVFQSKGPERKATLLKSLILPKMHNDEDIYDHVKKFFDILDKIHEMDMKIDDDLVTILLLYSVPDDYEQFRIAIETQDKLPDPKTLKIKMIDEFEARKRNSSEEELFAKKSNKN